MGMANKYTVALVALVAAAPGALAACTPSTVDTAGLQKLFTDGGAGYTLSLCAGQTYTLTEKLSSTADNQEISTEGYPTHDTRAILLVTGADQTTALQWSHNDAKIRNIQINGNRGSDLAKKGGANIEMGFDSTGQLVEYTHSFDPRAWSALHISEGSVNSGKPGCQNATVRNNEIGPSGHHIQPDGSADGWADGISLACANSRVDNNTVIGATDGGIVIFGAPGSVISNNYIHSNGSRQFGGINMVDLGPRTNPEGQYDNTLVENNTIVGGYATQCGNTTSGLNPEGPLINIDIAIGLPVWVGNDPLDKNHTHGGIVRNNKITGVLSFGIAVGSADNFTIANNTFDENSFFIGNKSGCTSGQADPTALLYNDSTITNIQLEPHTQTVGGKTFTWTVGNIGALLCYNAPTEAAWPYDPANPVCPRTGVCRKKTIKKKH